MWARCSSSSVLGDRAKARYVLEAPGGVRLIVIAQNTDVATGTERLAVGERATAWLRPDHARVLAS